MQAICPGDILLIEPRAVSSSLQVGVLRSRQHHVVAAANTRGSVSAGALHLRRGACSLVRPNSDGRMICHALESSPELGSPPVAVLVDSPQGSHSAQPSNGEYLPPDDCLVCLVRGVQAYRLAMLHVGALDVLRQEVARGYWNRLIFDDFNDSVLPGLGEKLEAEGCLWLQAG